MGGRDNVGEQGAAGLIWSWAGVQFPHTATNLNIAFVEDNDDVQLRFQRMNVASCLVQSKNPIFHRVQFVWTGKGGLDQMRVEVQEEVGIGLRSGVEVQQGQHTGNRGFSTS